MSDSGFTITAPTRLNADQWRSLTGNPSDVTIDDPTTGDGMVDFTFSNTWTVQCRPVGVGEVPEQSATSAITGGGTGDSTNPSAQQETLVWRNATVPTSGSAPTVTFENTGSSPISIKEVRYQFYSKDSQGSGTGGGSGRSGIPKSFTITDEYDTDVSQPVNYIEPFTDVSGALNEIPGGDTPTYTFTFYKNDGASGGQFDVDQGDFFIITVRFEINGETKRGTYFVGVSQ